VKIVRSVDVIDTHTAGEPTRVVVGGLPEIPAGTMVERRAWFDEHGLDLIRFLLCEPRGHSEMFGAVVSPPCDPEADVGVVFLETAGTLAMCGHGTIGAVTALVETGRFDGDTITLDTAAGLVRCTVDRTGGTVQRVTFRNVPAFYLDTVERDGQSIDLSYGGNLFALVDADRLGIPLRQESLPRLITYGMTLLRWFQERHAFRHPESGDLLPVELIEFYEHDEHDRNVVVFGVGQVDRSPCGTGTCAKMAYLHAHGQLAVGEPYSYRSVIDTEFVGRIVGTTTIGKREAIIPEITGSAYVIGMGSVLLTEGDPFPAGFRLMPSEEETSPLVPSACADTEQDRPPPAG